MDVTCERCGTEYEFDETLVSDRGTTVKCTNCGHLFKVFRSDASISGAKSWQVELSDGTVRTLTSLKELQRLISDGALTATSDVTVTVAAQPPAEPATGCSSTGGSAPADIA